MDSADRSPAPTGDTFIPPFCPNPDCPHHHDPTDWRWKRSGFFVRSGDGRPVRRFRCIRCGRSFSTRTFLSTYWLKRHALFIQILKLSVVCASLRQIASHLGTTHPTVMRHVARGGRIAMLFHRSRIQGHVPSGPVAFDGFESFEYSQFFPLHVHITTSTRSWFLLHFTDSPLRRKGRMTAEQKARRREIERQFGRPDPKAVEKDVAELLETTFEAADPSAAIELHSDEHKAYPRAIGRLSRARPALATITHDTTASSAPRSFHNPLFSVNLADLLFRHTGANHKRETIAFSRIRQAIAERTGIHVVWRNYIKSRREKKPPETAAMVEGIENRPLSWEKIFTHRLFPTKIPLPPRWRAYYWRLVKTVVYPRQSRHTCRYAF